jgi:hypothetical protein
MCVQTVPTLVWAVRVDRVLFLREDNQSLVVDCCRGDSCQGRDNVDGKIINRDVVVGSRATSMRARAMRANATWHYRGVCAAGEYRGVSPRVASAGLAAQAS